MKFILHIFVKMTTIVDILTFISRINTSVILKSRKISILVLWAVEILCSAELSMNIFFITSRPVVYCCGVRGCLNRGSYTSDHFIRKVPSRITERLLSGSYTSDHFIRKVPSRITERLLSGRKESNQTNKQTYEKYYTSLWSLINLKWNDP